MPRTITLADPSGDPVKVELFEHHYILKPVTRSVQKALEKIEGRLAQAAEDDDSDKFVGLVADGMDALLTANGTPVPPAKKVIQDAWKQDRLSLGQLRGLYESIQEAAAERPT